MTARLALLLVLVGLLAACRSYEPRPIVPRAVLDDLNAIRLEVLRPPPEDGESVAPVASRLDLEDGASIDEAVAVALALNPDLRAFRRERGVAEGELVEAGLLPNPSLELGALTAISFGSPLFGLFPIWAPPRPGEIEKRQDRARGRIDEVRAEVAAREWTLAAEVRKAWLAVVAGEEQVRIADAAVRLRERILRWISDRRDLGDASKVDVNLARIELATSVRERLMARNELLRLRFELNRLIGLPPRYPTALEVRGDPLGYVRLPFAPPVLESVMVHNRPRLRSTLALYKQAETNVDLAYLARWPWFGPGPAYERDATNPSDARDRIGVSLTVVNIPVFNVNQGRIAIAEAWRERVRETFTAEVHAGRAELHEGLREIRAQEEVLELFQATIRPALDENAALTEAGFEMHEFNLVQLITTQDLVLRNRREFVRAELDYWRAVYDLERVLGATIAPRR